MNQPILEVIATSVEDAEAAAEGGAHRLEVVSRLEDDGLTPELDVVEKIADRVNLPLRVMVRPRNVFGAFSPVEMAEMTATVGALARLDVEGVVIGFLTPEAEIDFDALDRVLANAGSLGVTFHRAFDRCRHLYRAVVRLAEDDRIDRLLTSGGARTALGGVASLSELQRLAGTRLTLIAAAGITAANVTEIAFRTGLHEFHVGRSVRTPETASGRVDAQKVAEICSKLMEVK